MHEVIRSHQEIRRLLSCRFTPTFTPPSSWKDSRFAGFNRLRRYTPTAACYVDGISTFGARDVRLHLDAANTNMPAFGTTATKTLPATQAGLRTYLNCIVSNGVRIVEHPLALATGMGIVAQYTLAGATSFPSFDSGTAALLDLLEGNLTCCGEVKPVTVREPVAMRFSKGAYAIFEPDDGSHRLVIDHQVYHPNNVLGAKRLMVDVEPATIAYLARARAMSHGLRTRAMKVWFRPRFSFWNPTRLPFLGLNLSNVAMVDTHTVLNGQPQFETSEGNLEPIAHEIIDKLGPLGLIPGLVGRLTTFRTNHVKDLLFLQRLVQKLT